MKKHVLFAIPKWCDANPALGFTNDLHNLIATLSYARSDYIVHSLHTDECVSYGLDPNERILKYCKEQNISLVIYSLLCNMPQFNPSTETMRKLKSDSIKQCIIWPDTGPIWGMQTINEIADAVDLHVSIDCPRSDFHTSCPRRPNHIDLWTPEDPGMFFYHPQKDIDVAFLGSTNLYQDRIHFLSGLERSDIKVVIGGGQRQAKLSPQQYAEIVRRSKIIINFPLNQTGVFFQAKGRIFETAACGGMILDMNNPSTDTFFKLGESYAEFIIPEDLVAKIQYYLTHEKDRQKIAQASAEVFYQNYTAIHFWNAVIDNLEKQSHESQCLSK